MTNTWYVTTDSMKKGVPTYEHTPFLTYESANEFLCSKAGWYAKKESGHVTLFGNSKGYPIKKVHSYKTNWFLTYNSLNDPELEAKAKEEALAK